MENETNKNINIANDVITTIVTVAAKEVEGVAGITNQIESSMTKIFKKKNLVNNIEVETDEDAGTINIEVAIAVNFGYELKPTAIKVQEKVKDAIETMTNYKVEQINVRVANVKENTKEK